MKKVILAAAMTAAGLLFAQEAAVDAAVACECKAGEPCVCGEGCACGAQPSAPAVAAPAAAVPVCECKAGKPCICGEGCRCGAACSAPCQDGKCALRGGPNGHRGPRPHHRMPKFKKCTCCEGCEGVIILPPDSPEGEPLFKLFMKKHDCPCAKDGTKCECAPGAADCGCAARRGPRPHHHFPKCGGDCPPPPPPPPPPPAPADGTADAAVQPE